jgi:hypothetical protein
VDPTEGNSTRVEFTLEDARLAALKRLAEEG